MAPHEQSQAIGQLAPEPTVVTQRRPRPSPGQTSIASHSQSGSKRTKWAGRVDPDQIRAWGRSIARRESSKAQVLKEVLRKYGTSEGTAEHWFNSKSGDGLTPTGKSLLKPVGSNNSPGAGLSEAEFLHLSQVRKSGQSISKSLASIDRGDIPSETARFWFDSTAEHGLSEQGKRVLETIRRNDYIDGR
jgi:hypothetical protein